MGTSCTIRDGEIAMPHAKDPMREVVAGRQKLSDQQRVKSISWQEIYHVADDA